MVTLSIYIPTWNRPHLLDRLLQSIEPQLTPDVEVFVSVNKSPATYHLPKWVKSRATHINIGGDANIITGPTLVNGEYVWVIGDDDHLLPGAINATMRAIEQNPALIIHPDGKFDLGVRNGETFATYTDFCEAVISAGRARTISAHTLISSNTFTRNTYDPVLALQKIDSRYGFHYGMLTNILRSKVVIADQPTMVYGHEASIFQHSKEMIDEHMNAYPQVMYDIYDWITVSTGYPIPYDAWGRGFY